MRISPLAIFLAITGGLGQAQQVSASDLIKQLSPAPGPFAGLFECGLMEMEAAKSRAIAETLVRMGPSVLPDIENALDSIGESGKKFSVSAPWLLYAFAKIKGLEAYPRLHRMADDLEWNFMRYALDNALALSLGLTSYLHGSLEPADFACRGPQPRGALDNLILTWERNDRTRLEASLSPSTRAILHSLLKKKRWTNLRDDLWHGRDGDGAVMGYRFDYPGRWGEPEEPLDPEDAQQYSTKILPKVEVNTFFMTGSGQDCGEFTIKFLWIEGSQLRGRYVIDSSNLEELLGSIASCASR